MRKTLILFAACAATPALAHGGHGEGFAAGWAHPFHGLDHILAMVAVGLWAALRRGRALYAWPASFVAAMAAGFALAQANVAIPMLEPMIAATVVALGAAIAVGVTGPVWLGAAAIALAGLAHGFAHGLEVSGSALAFAGGFSLATIALHLFGIAAGAGMMRLSPRALPRLVGGGVAAAGLALALS